MLSREQMFHRRVGFGLEDSLPTELNSFWYNPFSLLLFCGSMFLGIPPFRVCGLMARGRLFWEVRFSPLHIVIMPPTLGRCKSALATTKPPANSADDRSASPLSALSSVGHLLAEVTQGNQQCPKSQQTSHPKSI